MQADSKGNVEEYLSSQSLYPIIDEESNLIGDSALSSLVTAKLKHLRSLYLSPNFFIQITTKIYPIQDATISFLPALQKFKFCNLVKDARIKGSNNIGNMGCQYLSKSKWPNLQQLILCKVVSKQLQTVFRRRDAGIFQKDSGASYKNYHLVQYSLQRFKQDIKQRLLARFSRELA